MGCRLYEIHNDFGSGFNWFYGGGAHLGLWSEVPSSVYVGDWAESYTIVGLDLIVGLDYTLPAAPINLSFDWKPTIRLISNLRNNGFGISDWALSARYTIN